MTSAILLIAHGSRRKEANDELLRLAETLRQRLPDSIIETAFLELAEPGIPEGVRRCVAQGAREVRLVPYFLSPGMHVTRDLEEHRRQFQRDYAAVRFSLSPPLGGHSAVLDIVVDLATQPLPPDDEAQE
jgi:sirohydrochlorin ferrochelatase